jgi:hypothetical protein
MDKTSNLEQTPPLQQTAVRRSAYAVIPDAERLDIGKNTVIAVFQYRHQAEEWAKSMWEKFYLIEEVQSEHFS